MTEKEYRDPERERKRLRTIRARKGPNWMRENAIKAGKLTPTKFNSQTGRDAINKRWEKVRAEKARKGNKNVNRPTSEGPRYQP